MSVCLTCCPSAADIAFHSSAATHALHPQLSFLAPSPRLLLQLSTSRPLLPVTSSRLQLLVRLFPSGPFIYSALPLCTAQLCRPSLLPFSVSSPTLSPPQQSVYPASSALPSSFIHSSTDIPSRCLLPSFLFHFCLFPSRLTSHLSCQLPYPVLLPCALPFLPSSPFLTSPLDLDFSAHLVPPTAHLCTARWAPVHR